MSWLTNLFTRSPAPILPAQADPQLPAAPVSLPETESVMSPYLTLLLMAPQLAGGLLTALHDIILAIEKARPGATGPQKAEAAINLASALIPELAGTATQLVPVISTLVTSMNQVGGALAAIRTGVQVPVLAQSAQTAPVAQEPAPQPA